MTPLERLRVSERTGVSTPSGSVSAVYSPDLALLLALVAAADDMPDEVACNMLGADRYAEEFQRLRDTVAALKAEDAD